MSLTDWGLGIATGGLYNVGKKAWDHFQVSGAPGVGGPAQDPSRLVQQQDGTYLDPVTGTTYNDAWGQTPIQAPNTSQQIATDTQNQRNFLDRIKTDDARGTEAFGGQQRLAGQLENTIRNPNAPSVARAQLDATIGNIDRQQLSGISGVGAPNVASARRQALQNMANLDLGAAGQGAILRANEVAGAQNQLGNVYQNMAGNALQGTNQNIGAGLGFGQQAMSGAQANQQLTSSAQATNQGMAAGLLTGGLATGSNFLTKNGGSSAGAAAAAA